MSEKELKAMTYEALKAFADENQIPYQEGLKKVELIDTILKFFEEKEPAPQDPEPNPESKTAFSKELEKRMGSTLKDSAFQNELLRRQGKRTKPRTFAEELKIRQNKTI